MVGRRPFSAAEDTLCQALAKSVEYLRLEYLSFAQHDTPVDRAECAGKKLSHRKILGIELVQTRRRANLFAFRRHSRSPCRPLHSKLDVVRRSKGSRNSVRLNSSPGVAGAAHGNTRQAIGPSPCGYGYPWQTGRCDRCPYHPTGFAIRLGHDGWSLGTAPVIYRAFQVR